MTTTTTTTASPCTAATECFTGSRWEYVISWGRATFRRTDKHVVADASWYDSERFRSFDEASEFWDKLYEGHTGDLVVWYEAGIYTYEDGDLVEDDVMATIIRTFLDADGRTVELEGDMWPVDLFDRAVREGACK